MTSSSEVIDLASDSGGEVDLTCESSKPSSIIVIGDESPPPPAKKQKKQSGNVTMENSDTMEELQKRLKCSICLDPMKRMSSTTCGHVFCKSCIVQAIQAAGQCPLCKKPLTTSDIHNLFL